MSDYTLLERLANPDRARRESLRPDPSAVLGSVIRHLGKMLNVRVGSCLARPDYGMPDFNDLVFEFPSALPVIARAIRRQMDLFEPRVKHARVTHIPDPDNPLRISFRIQADIDLHGDSYHAVFEILLGGDGRVQVRD